MSGLHETLLADLDDLSDESFGEDENAADAEAEDTDDDMQSDGGGNAGLVLEGGTEPAEILDTDELEKLDFREENDIGQLAKLHGSTRLRDVLLKIDNQLGRPTEFDEFSALDSEYHLVVQANNMQVDIENDVLIVQKFIRENYNMKFADLDRLIPDPALYITAVKAMGNAEVIDTSSLEETIPKATLMTVAMEASTSSGTVLPASKWRQIERACSIADDLESARKKVFQYVTSRMSMLAPNLSAIVGTTTAANLLGVAGGLVALANMPGCNVVLLGARRKAFTAFSAASNQRHTGFLYRSDIVKAVSPKHRMKLQRTVGSKCVLAARMDLARDKRDGAYGAQLREAIERRIDRLEAPPPARITKALPVPNEGPKKRRGGQRARKAKEAYAQTQLRQLQNRIAFGEAEEEVGAFDETKGMGLIGRSSGNVRAGAGDAKTKAKMSKSNKLRQQILTRAAQQAGTQTSGTATSLVITPHQGFQLQNAAAAAAAQRVKEANDRWFAAGRFSFVGIKGQGKDKKFQDSH